MRHEATKARRHKGERGRRAFTLVELLVVIAIIGILIGAIAFVGVPLIGQQRARYTQSILRTVSTAIDQFATDNPLRQLYNKPGAATFGAFPPYRVAGSNTSNTVLGLFPEPPSSGTPDLNSPADNVLANRLWRDLAGNNPLSRDDYVSAALSSVTASDPLNDNRALTTYLAIYGGGVLNQVPQDRLKPVNPNEIVNPTGKGTAAGAPGAVSVLIIQDAWDVPIEYFLNVKIEAISDKQGNPVWKLADRQPVIASRGVTREEYEAGAGDGASWIFSQPLPTPLAFGSLAPGGAYQNLRDNGTIQPPANPTFNGWLRARGEGDVVPFVP